MLRRPRIQDTPLPSIVPPEFEVVPVIRLECVLDTGLPLSFDLDQKAGDCFSLGAKWLNVTLGKRAIQIAAHRILFIETRPDQSKRVVAPPL